MICKTYLRRLYTTNYEKLFSGHYTVGLNRLLFTKPDEFLMPATLDFLHKAIAMFMENSRVHYKSGDNNRNSAFKILTGELSIRVIDKHVSMNRAEQDLIDANNGQDRRLGRSALTGYAYNREDLNRFVVNPNTERQVVLHPTRQRPLSGSASMRHRAVPVISTPLNGRTGALVLATNDDEVNERRRRQQLIDAHRQRQQAMRRPGTITPPPPSPQSLLGGPTPLNGGTGALVVAQGVTSDDSGKRRVQRLKEEYLQRVRENAAK